MFHLLKGQPNFPKNTDSHRLMRLLREMESDGHIYQREVRTPDRKKRQVFTCVPETAVAPVPDDMPLVTSDGQKEVCANEAE